MTNKEQQLQAFIDATLAMAEAHKEAIDLVNAVIIANMKYLVTNNIEYNFVNNALGADEEYKAWSANHSECKRLEKIAMDVRDVLMGNK
mgnify:CR=1 FL=1